MQNKPPDESLSVLLQGWKLNAEPSPGFSEVIWQRIALREKEAASSRWTAPWKPWLNAFTHHTDLAWGIAAALIAITGATWLGIRTPSDSQSNPPSPISYLASVDPYRMNQ